MMHSNIRKASVVLHQSSRAYFMRVWRNKYVPQSKWGKTSNHMFFRTVLRTMPIHAHTILWMNLVLIYKGLSRWYEIIISENWEFDVLFCTKVLYTLFFLVSPFCCQMILHAMSSRGCRKKYARFLSPYAYSMRSPKQSIETNGLLHARVPLPIFIAPHMSWEFCCWASEAWASLRDVAGVQSLHHWLVKAPESVEWV